MTSSATHSTRLDSTRLNSSLQLASAEIYQRSQAPEGFARPLLAGMCRFPCEGAIVCSEPGGLGEAVLRPAPQKRCCLGATFRER